MAGVTFDLLVKNARVVTCAGPEGGSPGERLGVIEDGAIGAREGRIAFVGSSAELDPDASAARVIDAGGGAVTPGLVDAHTHLVFAGSRVDEFARRMAGEDYRAIAAAGGGIAATVRATREADDETLFDLAARRARAMRAHGVTTVEVKSGYGLTVRDEVRSLRVARRLGREGIVRVTPTFLGAHAIPPERRDDRARYVDEVCGDMLPAVVEEGLADSCDVYLDDGAFTLDEARQILSAAKNAGLRVRAHVGQFVDLGGAELLGELGALSADHLEAVSESGMRALADGGVVAVLLPGAWRTLRQAPPDVERLRAAGASMAVATDCNPGTSPCTDLGLCAALAVRDAGLTVDEALLGVTVIAAKAAGVADVGRIAVGARADLAVFPQRDARAIAYGIGDVRPTAVILGGRVVHEAEAASLPVW